MPKLNFEAFVNWAFLGLLSGLVFVLFSINTNIQDLNTKMAVVISQVAIADSVQKQHEAWLQKHNDRLTEIQIELNRGKNGAN